MEWNKIRELLANYYDGTTSLEEEQVLRQALRRDDCPADLQAEAMLFQHFAEEGEVESTSFSFTEETLRRAEENAIGNNSRFGLLRRLTGIAAMVAVCGFIYFQWFSPSVEACPTDSPVLAIVNNEEICDKEQAKKEAKEILLLVSQTLNESTDELQHLDKITTPQKITQ